VIKAQMEGGIGFGLGAVLYGGSMLMALPRAVVPIRHRDPKQAAHRAYLQRGNFGV
jgi:CO/xanthine dehydrogenase Mo-binding subunit